MSPFRSAVLTLLAGSASAQVITVAISPVLARLYAASDFGSWAIFLAVSGLLGAVSTGRFELAAQLPQSSRTAWTLAMMAVVHATATALAVSLIVAYLYVRGILNWEWLLLPVSIFASGITLSLGTLLVRRRLYSSISQGRVLQSSAVAVMNTALGVAVHNGDLDSGGGLLIAATVAGQVFAAIWSSARITQSHLQLAIRKFKYDTNLCRQYRDFPIYSLPEAAITSLVTHMPTYALTYLWGAAAAGQFSLAQRCLMLPVALLGGAMSQVNFREFSRRRAAGLAFSSDLKQAWRRAAVIGVGPAILLSAAGEPLFSVLFGKQWGLAGQMAAALALPTWLAFTFSVGSGAHVVLRLQHLSLLIATISLILKVATIAVLSSTSGSPVTLILTLSLFDVLGAAILNSYALRKAGNRNV